MKKILLFLLLSQLYFSQQWSISNAERNALISIYNTTSGEQWSQTWDMTRDPKTWFGVKVKSGSVTELNLRGNALKGSFPTSVASLPKLEKLDLSSNQLSGDVSPAISSLQNLIRLDISNNRFTGDPTAAILPLSKLTEISVGNNNFQFADLNMLLGNFPQLLVLDLSHTGLTAVPQKISTLTSLKVLNLSNNAIAQNFGNLSTLIQILELNLSGNQLIKIPTEVGNLTTLQTLDLSNNLFTTNFSAALSPLKKLEWLSLRSNQITAIPAEFSQLSNLVHLNLGDNKISSGFQTIRLLKKLEQLYLDKNEITAFPETLLQLPMLQMFSLVGNQMTGTIPDLIPALTFIDNNRYTKSEIRNFLLKNKEMADFTYSPQRYDELKTISASVGASAVLPQELTGDEYLFTWFKNLDEKTASTTESYYISNVTDSDFADYTCEAYYFEALPQALMEVAFYREPVTLANALATQEVSRDLIVYPNPTKDFLNIKTNRNDIEKVFVFDLSGKVIFSENSRRINVSNLPSGNYILSIKTSDGVKSFKFIKQ